MQTFYIYKVTNILNNKIYIGKTNDFKKRKLEHTRYDINDNSYFHKALKKYGLESFKWEIIDKSNSLKNINNLEKYYIKKFNSYKPIGYNMTKGGDGGSMWNAQPIVCLTLIGEYVARYDSAGEAEKIDGYNNSKVLKCCKNISKTHKGKLFMFEDDYLKNGAKKYIKPRSSCMKRVIQCDMNGNFINKFNSVKEASEKTGTRRTTLSSVLTNNYKSANGFIFVYEENYPIKDLSLYRKKKKGRRIAQINIETGEIIEVFDRTTDAAQKLGVNYKAIHKVIDLSNRTAYGYKWISQ